MVNARYCFYFAPHQDDELTNLGVPVCRDLDDGNAVFCVLCTDGSVSGARRLIGNGEICHLHKGRHPAGFSVPDFIAARDREYIASCRAMGIPEQNILLPDGRAADGSLTAAQAKTLILAAIGGLPPGEVSVNTLAPVEGCRQNPDHAAIGAAARELFSEGRFGTLRLFYEPIHLADGLLKNVPMETLRPGNEAQKKRLLDAAACYDRWDPENGWFAVGYHSVCDEFNAYTADPVALLAVTG